MKSIRITDKVRIGDGEPCFIIAEVGSNHNRDLALAKKLIDVAADAQADSVKFQLFTADKIYSKKTPMMSYLKEKQLTAAEETVYDLLKKLELPRQWLADLKAYAEEKGVMFLATPFDLDAVDRLEAVNVPLYKVASFEITHLPMLRHISQTGKPIILSTGMANLADIERALEAIHAAGKSEVILLHCAINYPPDYADIHLRAMHTLRQAFDVPVGFSDHTLDVVCDIAAVALGACAIEKHFTVDHSLPGPDHPFALEPDDLRKMVESIRQTEKALGSPIKKHTKAEDELHRLARRSLVAARNIAKGTVITAEMLEVKRPGFGIPTHMMEAVVGRRAGVDIQEDDILTWEMIG
jgi:N-acetylneuraminate synthase